VLVEEERCCEGKRQSVQERVCVCVCGVCVCGFGRQDVADTLACCTCYEDALFEEYAIAIRAGRGCHIALVGAGWPGGVRGELVQ
jgi:hypothetical protein